MEKITGFIQKYSPNHSGYRILEKGFAFVGFSYIMYKIFNKISFAYQHFIAKPMDLQDRYGSGSWAIVTGGTDGIGKEFCFHLAEQGFNIVNIARNQEKLKLIGKDLSKLGVQVKNIQADFNEGLNEGFFDRIYDQIKELDISILVNNVGIIYYKSFQNSFLNEIYSSFKVNILSQAMITKKLIWKLMARPKKGAIINISSISASRGLGYLMPYSQSKAFNDQFSLNLNQEYGHKLDIISVLPAVVSTNMSLNQKVKGGIISTRLLTESIFRQLGRVNRTAGHWIHDIGLQSLEAKNYNEAENTNQSFKIFLYQIKSAY